MSLVSGSRPDSGSVEGKMLIRRQNFYLPHTRSFLQHREKITQKCFERKWVKTWGWFFCLRFQAGFSRIRGKYDHADTLSTRPIA
ncbi:MAG: hypothetical protein DRH43_10510 [Deltaproteobacteria bacterium]|nr:MAG: hypothetical protein DRH43_10510 [Deltaproteobacteria bacterium]